ncbi:MAG: alpha,alpha-trehalase TreA [Pantoea sp. Brub]|nr:alpha,alpha-trehalase TreA [Pantoea sp. Brub]
MLIFIFLHILNFTIYSKNISNISDNKTFNTPDILLNSLYDLVQKKQIFTDQKTFADAVPKYKPSYILKIWKAKRKKRNFNLKSFIKKYFIIPEVNSIEYITPNKQNLRQHIESLWPILTKSTQVLGKYDSIISLPKPYVVPGGRFREIYYWDSYFTMLGLSEGGHWDNIHNMIDNFAFLIKKYGYIPNGNRSYYLSRSQPPFFSLMINLLANHEGDKIYIKYLPYLQQEYDYWMKDSEKLKKEHAIKRVIKLKDGTILNRYWDSRNVPRTESWLEDINTAKNLNRKSKNILYRELRTGAASGWDFSSRWLKDRNNLKTINITELAPIDLNSLMFYLETTLTKAYRLSANLVLAKKFEQLAQKRKLAINTYLWDSNNKWYADYNWKNKKNNLQITAATLFPLYLQIASNEQAISTAKSVEINLLKSGGLVTTTINSGQQWDAPNGWAPMQWIAIVGLENYNQNKLASLISLRFLKNVQNVYDKKHKIVEKYIVDGNLGIGNGGEYPLQDGFGWTNGVVLKLLSKYCHKGKICNDFYDISNSDIMRKT